MSTEIILKTHFGEPFSKIQCTEEESDTINIDLNPNEVDENLIKELLTKSGDDFEMAL